MVLTSALVPLVAGFLASVAIVALLLVNRRYHVLAQPTARSSHAQPTPSVGGLGIVIPIIGWLLYNASLMDDPRRFVVLVAALAVVAVVGLVDDIRPLSARLRLALQVLAAAAIVYALNWTEGGIEHWFWLAVVAVALVWHLNLFNFMDGIDGLAASQCVFYCFAAQMLAGGVGGWLGGLLWLLCGAGIGFLTYNWPQARIFMGDVGSSVLGLVLALVVLELSQRQMLPLVASLILLAGFWFDATYTLCVRILTKQPFTQAHRSHLYQRVAEKKGHLWTTLAFIGFAVFWLFPLAWLSLSFPAWQWLMLVAAVCPVLLGAVVNGAGRVSSAEESRHF